MIIKMYFSSTEEHDQFIEGITRAYNVVSDDLRSKDKHYYIITLEKHDKGGRKPKFTPEEIITMKLMKETGKSYKKIATHFDTSKTTVIKYICH